jgi:hypothetical protein
LLLRRCREHCGVDRIQNTQVFRLVVARATGCFGLFPQMRNIFAKTRSENSSQRNSSANVRDRPTAVRETGSSQTKRMEVWKLAAELGFTDAQVAVALKHGCHSTEQILDYILTHKIRPDGSSAGPAAGAQRTSPEPNSGLPPPADRHRDQKEGTNDPNNTEQAELQRAIELSRREYLRPRDALASSTENAVSKPVGSQAPTAESPLALASDTELQRAIEASLEEERKARQRFELSLFRPSEASLDPNTVVRVSPMEPIGLCNVGNTCYLNSLLQVYYHTPSFVRRVFSWREDRVDTEKTPPKAIDVVRELQRLFAYLLLSERRYADPTGFLYALAETLNSAALDLGAQHDLSEFNETFLRSIEAALQTVDNTEPLQRTFTHSFVQELHCRVMEGAHQVAMAVEMNPQCSSDGSGTHGAPQSPGASDTPALDAMLERLSGLQSATWRLADRVEGTTSALILDVASGNCRDLYAALDEYVLADVEYQPEKLTPGTPIHADSNPSDTQASTSGITTAPTTNTRTATKSVWFQTLAPVLFIYLQRLRFNQETHMPEKVNDFFDFAETIYLDRYLERNREAALLARLQDAQYCREYAQLEQELQRLLHLPGLQEPSDVVYEAVLERLRALDPGNSSHPPVVVDQSETAHREQALESLSYVYVTEKQQRERLETRMACLAEEMVQNFASLSNEAYRLQAVLVHEGAPEAGHYFVFIRSTRAGDWYEFNDQRVRRVSWEHVHSVGRGGPGTASAYALLYRREEHGEASQLPSIEEAKRLLPASLVAEIAANNAVLREEVEREKLRPVVESISERLRQPDKDETFLERPEWLCLHQGQVADAVLLATCHVYSDQTQGVDLFTALRKHRALRTHTNDETAGNTEANEPVLPPTKASASTFLGAMKSAASGPFSDDIRELATRLECADNETLNQLENAYTRAQQTYRVTILALMLTGIAAECIRESSWRDAASAITSIYDKASAGISYAGLTASLRNCVEQLVSQTKTSDPELSNWFAHEYLPEKALEKEPADNSTPTSTPAPASGAAPGSEIERCSRRTAPQRPRLPPCDERMVSARISAFGSQEAAVRWYDGLVRGLGSPQR